MTPEDKAEVEKIRAIVSQLFFDCDCPADWVKFLLTQVDALTQELSKEKRAHDLARSHSTAWRTDWEHAMEDLIKERERYKELEARK